MRLKANHMGFSLNQRGLFGGVVRDPNDRRKKLDEGKYPRILSAVIYVVWLFFQGWSSPQRLKKTYLISSVFHGKSRMNAWEDDQCIRTCRIFSAIHQTSLILQWRYIIGVLRSELYYEECKLSLDIWFQVSTILEEVEPLRPFRACTDFQLSFAGAALLAFSNVLMICMFFGIRASNTRIHISTF